MNMAVLPTETSPQIYPGDGTLSTLDSPGCPERIRYSVAVSDGELLRIVHVHLHDLHAAICAPPAKDRAGILGFVDKKGATAATLRKGAAVAPGQATV